MIPDLDVASELVILYSFLFWEHLNECLLVSSKANH